MLRFAWMILFAVLLHSHFAYSKEERNSFDEILLVVHYNHPYFQTSEFLEKLYACFPNIVFYGEGSQRSVPAAAAQYLKKINIVATQTGYFFLGL